MSRSLHVRFSGHLPPNVAKMIETDSALQKWTGSHAAGLTRQLFQASFSQRAFAVEEISKELLSQGIPMVGKPLGFFHSSFFFMCSWYLQLLQLPQGHQTFLVNHECYPLCFEMFRVRYNAAWLARSSMWHMCISPQSVLCFEHLGPCQWPEKLVLIYPLG